jgi:hypothetical protein
MSEQASMTAGFRPLLVLILAAMLPACAASRVVTYERVDLQRAEAEVPIHALLDIGIMLFDPGIPDDAKAQQKKFVFPDVRRAEARYMPYHLKNTLETSGHWGAVWVIPERTDAVDILVTGRIEQSDGLGVQIRVAAWDSTKREWLNKVYDTEVPEKAYAQYRDFSQDPYQNVYNEIANDLLAVRSRMGQAALEKVRTVSELRYAADLVPAAYAGHIDESRNGRIEVLRLPAAEDPMLNRLKAVREREYTLVDTLNEYYAGLYYDLSQPYENWRRLSREETIKYQELKRSARMRQLMGLAAILGAVAYEGSGGSNGAITDVAIFGGIEGIKSGFGKKAESDLHKESLRELGSSFDAEAQPLIVEVEGQTRRLTGTAEEKYKEWRRILHEIYATETGLAHDTDLSENLPPGVD